MHNVHVDLLANKNLIYIPCRFTYSLAVAENESAEYGAYTFEVNHLKARFRVAKITPTKIGQFVTLWKRTEKGTIQPYDISDSVDLVVISTRKDNQLGQFVFPKSVLLDKNIFSNTTQKGKLGFRVYPPWDKTLNKQAQRTQQWQLHYFLELSVDRPIDYVRAKALYLAEGSL